MTNLYEVFLTTHSTSRIAVVSAANLLDAHDRAVELFPCADWRTFIVVPTTMERVLRGSF